MAYYDPADDAEEELKQFFGGVKRFLPRRGEWAVVSLHGWPLAQHKPTGWYIEPKWTRTKGLIYRGVAPDEYGLYAGLHEHKSVTAAFREIMQEIDRLDVPHKRNPSRKRNPTMTVNGYEIGPQANLQGANLQGANLRGANLEGADLEGADLSKVNFVPKTDLQDANLRGANLRGANLRGADLSGAVLVGADLSGAALQGADLVIADLQDANLKGASLFSANLTRANLGKANLRDAGLQSAVLANADLSGANLEDAMLSVADLRSAVLWQTILRSAELTRANLVQANLWSANLESANLQEARLFLAVLRGANLENANLERANLRSADLVNTNLSGADLRGAELLGANLSGANLSGANLSGVNLTETRIEGANLEGANLEGAILPVPPRPARSYGAMTGPILKIGKPDSPSKAADFKRRYPAEFERLKADTGGRDFTDNLRESLREKYRTPFDWAVTEKTYDNDAQRLSDKPNKVMLLNVNTEDDRYTKKQRALLEKLAEVSRRSGHPRAKSPLFTIGWVRYAKDDEHGVLLIEEVQSDVEVVRTKMKGDTEEVSQLRSAGIDPDEYVEALDLLRPYSARFYEDAIGLIYQEAEALGYTVEMLGYGDKRRFGSPQSVYTDLPKRLGMSQKRESEVPTAEPLRDRVSYYKPNPAKRPRRRR